MTQKGNNVNKKMINYTVCTHYIHMSRNTKHTCGAYTTHMWGIHYTHVGHTLHTCGAYTTHMWDIHYTHAHSKEKGKAFHVVQPVIIG